MAEKFSTRTVTFGDQYLLEASQGIAGALSKLELVEDIDERLPALGKELHELHIQLFDIWNEKFGRYKTAA